MPERPVSTRRAPLGTLGTVCRAPTFLHPALSSASKRDAVMMGLSGASTVRWWEGERLGDSVRRETPARGRHALKTQVGDNLPSVMRCVHIGAQEDILSGV